MDNSPSPAAALKPSLYEVKHLGVTVEWTKSRDAAYVLYEQIEEGDKQLLAHFGSKKVVIQSSHR
jgi:hypothetical protein